MNKRRRFGIISLALMVFAVIFSYPNFNDFVIGEFLFYKLGIPLYSNGTTGLHYPVIFSWSLFFIGLVNLRAYGRDIHPYYHRIILIILLIGPIVYKGSYFNIYKVIKTNADGLNSIGYERSLSTLQFVSTEDNKNIEFNCSIRLKNYSDKEQHFNIKLIPNKDFTQDFITDFSGVNAKEKSNSPVPQEFYLLPKSERDINASFYFKAKKGFTGAKGNYKDFDVVLFNGKEENKFIKLVY